jgi:2-amino-4-hydroxy-6-hydroxymethyldihydropteridine diphosphokinase
MKPNRERVFIALGSNIEPRLEYIQKAITEIQTKAELVRTSSVIETEPMGFEAETNFLNAVIEIKTELTPRELLLHLKEIELSLGRSSKSENKNYTSRTIDLDILYYGQQILVSPELTIPHPEIFKRDFVLIPLREIAGDFLDPFYLSNKKLMEL